MPSGAPSPLPTPLPTASDLQILKPDAGTVWALGTREIIEWSMSMRSLQACPVVSITLHQVMGDGESADPTTAGLVVNDTVTVRAQSTTSPRIFALPWTVVRPARQLDGPLRPDHLKQF